MLSRATPAANSDTIEVTQRRASDPAASVWVSASAGTGKTHVLTMRVLRLMLTGVSLDRILCLTYTTAAASEMSQRVFAALSSWVTASSPELGRRLTDLLGRRPTPVETALARTLFASTLDAPGGLKIQTIHAFSQTLLKRFPLEAGVPPGFAVLDEGQAARLRREAIDEVLTEATRRGSSLAAALAVVIRYAVDDTFDERLAQALSNPEQLRALDRAARAPEYSSLAEGLAAIYRVALALSPGATLDSVDQALMATVSNAELNAWEAALRQGSANDQKAADRIALARREPEPTARISCLETVFCTEKGEPRRSLMTGPVTRAFPEIDAASQLAQTRFCALLEQRRALEAMAASTALMEVALAVKERYERAKARRATLDFHDLIGKAAALLRYSAIGGRDGAEWVLYKLDGGLEHILVDESQDTSPLQWAIVNELAAEFFATDGRSGDRRRSLFAVGDEKQSIYSFQGAAPEMFAAAGQQFARAAIEAGHDWREIDLETSFRSTAPVLAAVDKVFADPTQTPGVSIAEGSIRHHCERIGQAGLVELWPVEPMRHAALADPWAPLEEPAASEPMHRLAARIAATIGDWLDRGERLTSEDRPIHAGDVLILLRKRRPFAAAMIRALEAARIPVAGADRITLADEIAVQDLVALGDVVTLTEDDLALACLLKSPLVGFDDDDLFAIAYDRGDASLWSALRLKADSNNRYASAMVQLDRWRSDAARMPPFEFYANVLDRDGGRAALLARLGAEANDGIDEFLNTALAYDDRSPPSLIAFLTAFKTEKREIKRDAEHARAAVRIMTVHGAKGLEAPIVFLPDTCSAAGAKHAGLIDIEASGLPAELKVVRVWPVRAARTLPPISAATALRATRESEELNRLLYVAMTRARDRLYICGYDGKRTRQPACWYERAAAALKPIMDELGEPDGSTIYRLSCPQAAPAAEPRHPLRSVRAAARAPVPTWMHRQPPAEGPAATPLTPSRILPYGPPLKTGANPASSLPSALPALDRGTLIHALLQHLPNLPKVDRLAAAERYLAKLAAALDPAARQRLSSAVLAILDQPALAHLFADRTLAEVPVAALIRDPTRPERTFRVTAKIDRLCVRHGRVLIVDYKSGAEAATVAATPEAYLFQLATYQLAVTQIFPDLAIDCAILWTDSPRLVEMPSETIRGYAARIWETDLDHLTSMERIPN